MSNTATPRKPRKVKVGIYLPPDEVKALDDSAGERGLKRSDVARQLMKLGRQEMDRLLAEGKIVI